MRSSAMAFHRLAAVAAFLGHRAKVKQVHYRTGQAWAQQGRVAIQGHQIIHGAR